VIYGLICYADMRYTAPHCFIVSYFDKEAYPDLDFDTLPDYKRDFFPANRDPAAKVLLLPIGMV